MRIFLFFIVGITLILFAVTFIIWDNRPSLLVDKQTGPWSVGYTFTDSLGNIESCVGQFFIDSSSVSNPGPLRFLADPFLYVDSTGYYIFVEFVTTGNGNIACFHSKKNDTLKFEYKGVVLDEPFHLSYPQVFRYESKFYMLPETQKGGAVILYETDNFPFDWKRSRALLPDANIKDPTIWLNDNKIRIFGTQNDHLYCWQAQTLFDTFQRFEKPLLVGTESRPGGRIFRYGNSTIIPIQNNSHGYGTGLSLYEIIQGREGVFLKPYRRKIIATREDITRFSHGMHHLDFQFVGEKYLAVFDGNPRIAPPVIDLRQFVKYYFLNVENECILYKNRNN